MNRIVKEACIEKNIAENTVVCKAIRLKAPYVNDDFLNKASDSSVKNVPLS